MTSVAASELRVRLSSVVPFISTTALQDLLLLVVLAPVFWLLGLEQFVVPPLLTWSVVKMGIAGLRMRMNVMTVLLILLLAAMLLSALFIDQPLRYITFIRNTSMYFSGLLVAIIVFHECRSWQRIRLLIVAVAVMMGVSSFIGLLGISGLFRPTFSSAAALLLPDAIASTDYGQQIVNRATGRMTWFSGLGSYFRVSGIFLYSTMHAAALALTIPLGAYLTRAARGWRSVAWGLVTGMMLINFVFTTGRTAWLSLALAALICFVLESRRLSKVLRPLLIVLLVVSGLVLLPQGSILDAAESTIYARGSGSTVSRMTIYVNSLEGFLERPLFGWGTERDIVSLEGFRYPAGSHSWYLGMLYKHGLVGFSLFITFMALVANNVRRNTLSGMRPRRDSPGAFLGYARWSLLTIAMIGLTSVPDLDATLMLATWVVLFASVAASSLVRSPDSSTGGTQGVA